MVLNQNFRFLTGLDKRLDLFEISVECASASFFAEREATFLAKEGMILLVSVICTNNTTIKQIICSILTLLNKINRYAFFVPQNPLTIMNYTNQKST